MSIYTDRKNFFKERSESHYLVKHGHLVSPGEELTRKSFMDIANEEELSAAVINSIHFPCVVHVDFNGKPVDKSGSVRIRNNNELLFLDKPEITTQNPDVTKANDVAYTRSFGVMMDFIAWMYNEYEENGSCGPFKEIDLNLFSWRKQDYISDGLVGWILNFSDEVKADAIINFDQGKWVEFLTTEDGVNIVTEDQENIIIE